jgi:transposase-like protein
MRKYNSYTVEFKIKIIKFAEQNGNCAVEREFAVNEVHIHYWCKQNEGLCKAKCSVTSFQGPKTSKFLELEEELNTSRKHITMSIL